MNEPPRSKLRGIPKIIQSTSSFPDLIGESRNKKTGFSGQAREWHNETLQQATGNYQVKNGRCLY